MRIVQRTLLIFFWTFIIGLSLWFFFDSIIMIFFGYRISIFGDSLFNNQLWVVMHLIGGTFALLLGPLQFWKGFRNRFLKFHRTSGKLYMIGVLLAGVSAFRLSLVSYCVPCRISLFILTILALLSTWFAWKTIKAKNIKAHRQFMIRSYICVLAFVLVRVDNVVPLGFIFGQIDDPIFNRTVNEYFFSFVPLLVAEILMIWIPSVRKQR
jgi:uncharacterized membrane protein